MPTIMAGIVKNLPLTVGTFERAWGWFGWSMFWTPGQGFSRLRRFFSHQINLSRFLVNKYKLQSMQRLPYLFLPDTVMILGLFKHEAKS